MIRLFDHVISDTWILVLLLTFGIQAALTSQEVANLRLKKLLDSGYDKQKSPTASSNSGGILVISVAIHLNDLILDEDAMSMRMLSDVFQSWTDDRLSPVTRDTKDLQLDPDSADLLWKPLIIVRNSRTTDNIIADKNQMILLTKNGRVILEQRIIFDVVCSNLTYQMRPLVCSVQIQLRQDVNSEVVLQIEKLSPEASLFVPRYTPTKMETSDCTRTTPTGTYSCKQLTLAFREEVDFFSTEIYGVSFLLVILSWIGFWIDGHQRQIFVRLGVGLTFLLILVAYGIGFRIVGGGGGIGRGGGSGGPGVPGSVEVWISFCTLFVLATLVEFAFAHVLLRIIPGKLRNLFCRKDYATEEYEETGCFVRAAQVIDVTCGLLFPLIFILFNVVYWGAYSLV